MGVADRLRHAGARCGRRTSSIAVPGTGRLGVAIAATFFREARTFLRREGLGLVAAAVIIAYTLLNRVPNAGPTPTGQEAFCYWFPSLADPYARADWTKPIAYVYSPAFLQGIALLKTLPWEAFLAAWTVLLLFGIRLLVGPRLWAFAIAFAMLEVLGGNIHVLLAVAIVAGFRWPAAWAFVVLTKVTPGVGLLWFAVRREWRNLGIALGATAAIVAVSWIAAPGLWSEWLSVLGASATKTAGTWAAIPVPVWFRLPIAAAVVVWGARTDRRWTVPVAAMLALPALWFGGTAMLLAAVALATADARGGARPRAGDAGRSRTWWRLRPTSIRAT